MKKIINSICVSIALFLTACSNKDSESVQNTDTNIPVQEVVGIGKVLPQDRIILLTLQSTAKVTKIHHQIGAELEAGDILLEIENTTEQIAVDQASAAAQSAKMQVRIAELDVQNARTKLNELRQKWQTSTALAAKNAETKERVTADSTTYAE